MPELEYFLVCESLSVDRATNRLSLFNIIEDVRCAPPNQQAPSISQMYAVACLNRVDGDEDADFQATFCMQVPGQEEMAMHVNFRMERPRVRLTLLMKLRGETPPVPGEVVFLFSVNGAEMARHTILVRPAPDGAE